MCCRKVKISVLLIFNYSPLIYCFKQVSITGITDRVPKTNLRQTGIFICVVSRPRIKWPNKALKVWQFDLMVPTYPYLSCLSSSGGILKCKIIWADSAYCPPIPTWAVFHLTIQQSLWLHSLSWRCPTTPTWAVSNKKLSLSKLTRRCSLSLQRPPMSTWAVSNKMLSPAKLTRLRNFSWQCPPMPTWTVSNKMLSPAKLTRLRNFSWQCPPMPTRTVSNKMLSPAKLTRLRSLSWRCPPMPTWAVSHLVASPGLCSECRPRSLSHTDSPRKKSVQGWVFYWKGVFLVIR